GRWPSRPRAPCGWSWPTAAGWSPCPGTRRTSAASPAWPCWSSTRPPALQAAGEEGTAALARHGRYPPRRSARPPEEAWVGDFQGHQGHSPGGFIVSPQQTVSRQATGTAPLLCPLRGGALGAQREARPPAVARDPQAPSPPGARRAEVGAQPVSP